MQYVNVTALIGGTFDGLGHLVETGDVVEIPINQFDPLRYKRIKGEDSHSGPTLVAEPEPEAEPEVARGTIIVDGQVVPQPEEGAGGGGLTDLNVADAGARILEVDDLKVLALLQQEEVEGKSRVGVLTAIEARRAELSETEE